MIRTPDQVKELFEEKCAMIEKTTGKSVYGHFMLQVGPVDAKTIMAQMEAFFSSGYTQARIDILGA